MKYFHGSERTDMLERELCGLRIGLITNPTGVDHNFLPTSDLLREKFNLKMLFSPEHGVRGDAQAGEKVDFYTDRVTGLPVYTMYGRDNSPAFEAFDTLDCVVYDIQDVGLRFYTYIYTLADAMMVAAKKGVRVVVLDRYNPLGLERAEGTMLDIRFASGVGRFAIPSRYALTVGEFARYINSECDIGCDLHVIPCDGLHRGDDYTSVGVPWVLPSPNLPTFDSVISYAGTVLLEGTNLSEGRGTSKPFEFVGAPWLKADDVVDYFNDTGIDGARLRPAYFKPTFSKYSGELCSGFQIHVTNRDVFRPFDFGVKLVDYVRKTHEEFEFLGENKVVREDIEKKERAPLFIDLLLGCDDLRDPGFDADNFIEKQKVAVAEFKEVSKKYSLYE